MTVDWFTVGWFIENLFETLLLAEQTEFKLFHNFLTEFTL